MTNKEDRRARLAARFDVEAGVFETGRGVFHLSRVRDPERLVDRIDLLDEDERIPYWAELWPSAIALARHVAHHPELVRGRDTVELGCGLGLAGMAAASAGARVVATDYDRDAAAFARLNAADNGLSVRHVVMDWRHLAFARQFDVVLASDVLYEARFLVPVARALDSLVAPGGRALVTEPGREVAKLFFELLRDGGWTVEKVGREPVLTVVTTVHVDVWSLAPSPA